MLSTLRNVQELLTTQSDSNDEHIGDTIHEMNSKVEYIYDKIVVMDDENINEDDIPMNEVGNLFKFRKFSGNAPWKKMNKKLRDLEMGLNSNFNDFFNMTMEMFEHQHDSLEKYGHNFAELLQCCRGSADDVSGFLHQLDSQLMNGKSANKEEEEEDGRSREQLRFDVNRIISAINEQKSLIIDGFDTRQRRINNINGLISNYNLNYF